MKAVGLDLSLVSTGVAAVVPAGTWTTVVRVPTELPTMDRLRQIRQRVMDLARGADLVVVEGLALHSQTGQHLTRAGLWHLVMERVDAAGIPWAQVPPASLKRYATGRGNAPKDQVLAAVLARFGVTTARGHDEADALILAAMGADHMGSPVVTMPPRHRDALRAVAWPDGRS